MPERKTSVSIDGDRWLINGAPTYAGREFRGQSIEGLLLNSRMVNAIFDDDNPHTRSLWRYPDTGEWDAERNTSEFVAMLPEYRARGLIAFTVNLQGGAPCGYYRQEQFREHIRKIGMSVADEKLWTGVPGPDSQPWHNSAFDAEGGLKRPYMDRLSKILDEADALGMVAIVGLFYQGQDERLKDEKAVRRAVDNACGWLLGQGYTNAVVEINNECNTRYEHEILQPQRVHELIEQARGVTHGGRRLLVSTSYGGRRVPDDSVAKAADFILMHGNGVTDPNRIVEMVEQARALPGYTTKPVLFNEDDHYDFDRTLNNFSVALSKHAGWGYFDPGAGAGGSAAFGNYQDGFQIVPVNWGINTPRKRAFFEFLKEVTGA